MCIFRNKGSLDLSWEGRDLSSQLQRASSACGRYCSTAGQENLIRGRGTLNNILLTKGIVSNSFY